MIRYGMTKAAQASVARGLAESVAGTAVTVNSVLAGRWRRKVPAISSRANFLRPPGYFTASEAASPNRRDKAEWTYKMLGPSGM
jgi:NAD(P)-dependent dehydrogenase (short-subunit alcohol dehydrogenase family)